MNAMTQTTAAAIPSKAEVHPALSRLRDARLLREMAYIDGRWTGAVSDVRFEVRDPASGLVVARVARLSADEATQAIDAAALALPPGKCCCRRSAPPACGPGMISSLKPARISPFS